VVVLEELPLTSSGKVDRERLPEPDWSQQQQERYVAPQTPTEEMLAQIWAEVLKVEHVGVNDNFFELGGHSLMMMAALQRLRAAMGYQQLSLLDLFRAPTVSALASLIDGRDTQTANLPDVERDAVRRREQARKNRRRRLASVHRIGPE
jgi:aryl carrier-like protein